MTKRQEFTKTLKESLSYDPDSGLFHWNKKSKPFKKNGHKPAGSASSNGYVYITFQKQKYLAHRLAFYFAEGRLPDRGVDVDHINGIRSDNRFSNLRLCCRSNNLANSNLSKGDLPRGVQKNGSGFMARIKRKNQTLYLGTFANAKDAGDAYLAARESLLGKFAIKGKTNEISHS